MLPIRVGGPGSLQVSVLASPAFLISAVRTRGLQASMLLKTGLAAGPHEAAMESK